VTPGLKTLLQRLVPASAQDFLRRQLRTDLPRCAVSYQGVYTQHSMQPLHQGRFARIYDQHRTLNPFNGPHDTRLRHYLACMFAEFSKTIPGDYLSAGISFGVAPRVIYDFVNFKSLGKQYHFVDPFLGINYPGPGVNPYNTDFEFVRRQYSDNAPVIFHRDLLPDCLPINGLDGGLAFVHMNTTHPKAESAAIPYMYENLNPGGFMVIDHYSFGVGQYHDYDETVAKVGAEIFSLVTGQGVIQKPFQSV